MKNFTYKATTKEGLLKKGTQATTSEETLARALRKEGLELISAHEANKSTSLFTQNKKEQRAFLSDLCEQLAALMTSGLTFTESLEITTKTAPNDTFKNVLKDVLNALERGATLTEAFTRNPIFFPPLFIATIQAGETSGDLIPLFKRLASYFKNQQKWQDQTRKALRYPLFMLAVALGASFFMLNIVIPEIIGFLNNLSANLPWSTRLLINLSDIFQTIFAPTIILVLITIITVPLLRKNGQETKRKIDGILLSLPLIKKILWPLARARFTASLGTLIQAGIDLPTALTLASQTLSNSALEQKASNAREKIIAGLPLSEATQNILSETAYHMIKVAEQAGNLAPNLFAIAEQESDLAQKRLDKLISTIEPALTLAIGLLMAWIVLATFGPLYGSLGTLGEGSL